MPKAVNKEDFPVERVRHYLEPGPIVLVSSRWRGKNNIMTMGWHMVMEFSPSLLGCMISSGNHSHRHDPQQRRMRHQPADDEADRHGRRASATSSGGEIDKFAEFGLTAEEAERGRRAADRRMPREFRVPHPRRRAGRELQLLHLRGREGACRPSPKHPETLHYTGDGVFMVSGKVISRKSLFRPGML